MIPILPTFEAFVLLFGIPGLVVLLAVLWRQKRSPAYLFCASIFWAYLLIVAGVTIFPIPLSNAVIGRRVAVNIILSRVNLVPLHFGGLFDLHPNVVFRELAENIFLTVPFGFGIPFLARVWEQRIFWLALAVGSAIEATQLMVSLGIGSAYRGVDINDVLLNAAGVLLGYAFFRALAGLFSAVKIRRRF